MKKIVSMVLALAMTLALAIPVFAEDPTFAAANADGHTFSLAGDTKTPTVKVYVPAANAANDKMVLNPYALPYKFGTETESHNDQVITKPIYLGSNSDVPVIVGMKVVATPAGDVVLASKSLAGDTKTTTKSVFIWGQVVGAGTGAAVPTTEPTTFATAYDATAGKSGDMILVAAETTRTGLYTIPASADTTAAANNTWACVKFFGDAVKAPTSAWAATDKVDLAITFTFTPSMNEG